MCAVAVFRPMDVPFAVSDGSAFGNSLLQKSKPRYPGVGWISRRRIPAIEKVRAISVSGRRGPSAGNDGGASGDTILRNYKRQNAPHEGEAFSLQWRHRKLAINDGLCVANSSCELIRLTAFGTTRPTDSKRLAQRRGVWFAMASRLEA